MSAKIKTVFVCSECGDRYFRWQGQCNHCKSWNSLEEKLEDPKASKASKEKESFRDLKEVRPGSVETIDRKKTGLKEFDILLGGGFVPGSVVLLGGEPGVGKSTLLLEIARRFTGSIAYVTGEESLSQVLRRAERLKIKNDSLAIIQENQLSAILAHLRKKKPDLVLIDSIQSVYESGARGFTGSISQIRESTQYFVELAKQEGCIVLITGHVTKDGQIAGPKLLEHAVDAVLYFESDNAIYRFIKAAKNRFGSTGEVAVFEMTATGLVEIPREKSLIDLNETGGIGSVLFPQVEGSRITTVEVQVLVAPAGFSSGRRIGENVEIPRLHLLAAIAEKYMGLKMSQSDVFVRIRGAAALSDPSADLALLAGIISSYRDSQVPFGLAIAGEVSLTGSIRSPSALVSRRKLVSSLGISGGLWGGRRDEEATEKDRFVLHANQLAENLFFESLA